MKKIGFVIFSFVLVLCVSCVNTSYNQDDSSEYQSSSTDYITYQDAPKEAYDYEDILKQANVCESAFNNLLYEFNLIPQKVMMPQYQGVLQQKLFWDANDAMDTYKRESEKLERLYRRHGFNDKAEESRIVRAELESRYYELQKQVLYMYN